MLALNFGEVPVPPPPPEVHWADGVFAGLDFEATGPDPMCARPVSAAFAIVGSDGVAKASWSEIIDCGVDVPEDAAAVHGITTERVRAEGHPVAAVMETLFEWLTLCVERRYPVVIMNASFDLPLFELERRRCNLSASLTAGAPRTFPQFNLLDPRVLDKQWWKYRRGGRKLSDLCATYGVALGQAHDALADVLMAIEVTRKLVNTDPQIDRGMIAKPRHPRAYPLWELQGLQHVWYAEQRDSLNSYWAGKGDPRVARGEWPWGELEACA